ncbi:hypothetical protein ACWPKO_30035 (plasmid) [Coraliomargarita sp. W4R53]
MSNHRKSSIRNAYRSDFLRSPAWFARRDRWFRKQERLSHQLACAACARVATKATLELHHLDYAGVQFIDGKWRAFERHDDLVPLHPYCHDLLHRLIDRDVVLSRHRTRRDATSIALEVLRVKLLEEARHE